MRGLQVSDMDDTGHVLAVDLRHVLDLFGERATQSQWLASEVWATGEEGMELEGLADGQTFITGEHLSHLVHRLVQVIDGEFSAFERSGDPPWIVIRAVDSAFYELFSPEPQVLDRVRSSFQRVSDCDFVIK